VDWFQLVQDGTHWWVVALVVMNSRSYGMAAPTPNCFLYLWELQVALGKFMTLDAVGFGG